MIGACLWISMNSPDVSVCGLPERNVLNIVYNGYFYRSNPIRMVIHYTLKTSVDRMENSIRHRIKEDGCGECIIICAWTRKDGLTTMTIYCESCRPKDLHIVFQKKTNAPL